MSKIIVLGAGMVGSAIAIDLTGEHEVLLTDISPERLDHLKKKCQALETLALDVTNETELKGIIQTFDLVVCAVPGFLGFRTLKCIIGSGKNVIDISFFPENSLDLDQLAKRNNVTAIVDCGVAPGMDNIILGRYNELLQLTDFECLVGGLPKVRKWPFFYKAPFSPIDVIEEYIRPARYVENGKLVVKEPLSDPAFIEFENIGTLQAFNSDGLRSILFTMPHINNMIEKTLRYPGHVDAVLTLKESGFFSTEKIKINGCEVSPLDFTSNILFNEWKLNETDEELTVMRITLKGSNEKGERVEVVYYLYDEFDKASKTSSMARTTGYTAAAAANLFLDGLFSEKGVFPPELVGKHEVCFDFFLKYLEERGVNYKMTTRKLD